MKPGEQKFLTPKEVYAPMLHEALQERSIAIVRPATPEEDEVVRKRLSEQCVCGSVFSIQPRITDEHTRPRTLV